MNEELGFQAALDAKPTDHTTRLVFADWLDEHNDPRAEGYRALGMLRKHSFLALPQPQECPFFSSSNYNMYFSLPNDWYELIIIEGKGKSYCPEWVLNPNTKRSEVEDAAALAFSKLTAEQKEQILAMEPCD